MPYPEKNAHYRNKPAWMDRAVAGEKRAQGGPVSIGDRTVGNGAGVREVAEAATEDAKDDLSSVMNKHRGDEFHDSGLRIPGKLKAQNDRAWPPGRAEGGRMEPLIDEKGNPNPDNYWDHLVEPSSPHAAQDARNQAAHRTRNTRAMPNSFPVGGEPKRNDDDHAEAAPMLDKEAQQKIGRGLGQSIGFKRGGRT